AGDGGAGAGGIGAGAGSRGAGGTVQRRSLCQVLIPLPSPPSSSLTDGLDPESHLARAASPTLPRLLATVLTDPSFESTDVSALVAELVEFAATYRLDNATSLVADSESDCPPSIGGESALGTDVLQDRQEDFECLAIAVPHLMAMLLGPNAPPSDESVEPSGPYPELVGCLITSGMGLMLGGRGPVVLTGYADTSWVDNLAMQRSSQGHTFSLSSGSISWRSTRSSSVLSSICEAEIYAGAMAAQELR
ncbi:unnamed protein product, partial [Closterium sp. NIES-53]